MKRRLEGKSPKHVIEDTVKSNTAFTYFPYSSLENDGRGEGDRDPPWKLPENGFKD